MKKIVLGLLATLSAMGFKSQIGGGLIGKKMLDKASEIDESNVDKVEIFLDDNFSSSVSDIADGTNTVTVRCYINEQAASLKKAYGLDHYKYRMTITVTSSASKKHENVIIFTESENVDTWSDIHKGDGYLEFTIDKLDFIRMLDEKSIYQKDKLAIEIALTTSCRIGAAMATNSMLSKGSFTLTCDGEKGKWNNGALEESMAEYKSGNLYEANTSSEKWKKMLSYSKNYFKQKDIVHLKVGQSSVGDDLRTVTDISVVVYEDGVCWSHQVTVWEMPKTGELSNYVPQTGSEMSTDFCDRKEEIRNVK